MAALPAIEITARDSTGPVFDKVTGGLRGIDSAAKGIVGSLSALGGFLSVGLFAGAIKSAIDYADRLNDLSKQTGIAVDTLGGLGYAAQQSGVDLETVARASQRLARNMAEAAGGQKDAIRVFEAMGVSVKNADGSLKGLDSALGEIADKFAAYADGPEKAALAQGLFSKGGEALIPLLNEGGEAMRALVEEFNRYGGVSQETAARADAFNDSIGKIQMIMGALWREIASAVLPVLTSLTGMFVQLKNDGTGFKEVAEGVTVAVKLMGSVAVGVGAAFSAVGKSIASVAAALVEASQGNFRQAWDILKMGGQDVVDTTAAAIERAKTIWTADTAAIAAATETNIGQKTRAPIVAATDAAQKFGDELQKLIDRLYGKEVGLDPSFRKDLELLYEGYQKGKLGIDEYRAAVVLLIKQQDFADAEFKALLATFKSFSTVTDQVAKDFEDLAEAIERNAEGLDEINSAYRQAEGDIASMVRELEFEADALMMTRREREIAIIDRELERKAILLSADALSEYRARAIAALDKRDALQGQIDLWNEVGRVAQGFFSDLLHNGSSAFKRLWENFKSWALEALAAVAARQVVVSLVGSVGGMGSAAASAGGMLGGGGGGVGDIFSAGSNLLGGGGTAAGMLAGFGNLTGIGFGAVGAGALGPIVPTFGSALLGGMSAPLATAGSLFSGGAAAFGGGMAALGATLGAAIPIIGFALAIASMLGVFDRGGPKVGGFASSISGLERFFTPDQGDSTVQAGVDALGDAFNDSLRALGGSGTAGFALGFDQDPEGDAGSRISAEAQVNGQSVFSIRDLDVGRDEGAVEEAIKIAGQRAILAALQASDLPEAVAAVLRSVDAASASSEEIEKITALASAFKALGDALGGDLDDDIARTIELMGRTATDAFRAMGAELVELANGFDGSLESTQQLTAATLGFRQAGVQMIAQIEQMRNALSGPDGLFAQTIRDFTLQTLSPEDQYAFLNKEIGVLFSRLSAASDPQVINDVAGMLNNTIRQAFGLLDETQQGAGLQGFLDLLNRASALTDERLDSARDATNDALRSTLDQVRERFDQSIDKFVDAVRELRQPMPPIPVQVTVDVDGGIGSGAAVGGQVYSPQN